MTAKSRSRCCADKPLPGRGGLRGPELRTLAERVDGVAKHVLRRLGTAVPCKPVEIPGNEPDTVGAGLRVQHRMGEMRKAVNLAGKRTHCRIRSVCRPQGMGKTVELAEIESDAGGHARLQGESVRSGPLASHCDGAHVCIDRALGPPGIPEHGNGIPNGLTCRSGSGLDQDREQLAVREFDFADKLKHQSLRFGVVPSYLNFCPETCQVIESKKKKARRQLRLRALHSQL